MFETLNLFGILQSFILGVYFIVKRKKPGYFYYSLALFSLSGTILFGYLYETHLILKIPFFARMGFPIICLVGPFFFLAILQQLNPQRKLTIKDTLLFSAAIGEIIYLIPFFVSSLENKMKYLLEDLQAIHFDCVVMSNIAFINTFIFMALSSWMVWKSLQQAKNEMITPWENFLNSVFFMHFTLVLGFFLISIFILMDSELINSDIMSGFVSLFIIVLGYVWMFRSKTIDDSFVFDIDLKSKYQKSLLSKDALNEYNQKIISYLEKEKPYTNPEFQLKDIAEHLNVSLNHTSQIINRTFGQKFSELIAKYRVEQAKTLLTTPEFSNYSILGIAMESGFNSKSSFNQTFKKVTGKPPSNFR